MKPRTIFEHQASHDETRRLWVCEFAFDTNNPLLQKKLVDEFFGDLGSSGEPETMQRLVVVLDADRFDLVLALVAKEVLLHCAPAAQGSHARQTDLPFGSVEEPNDVFDVPFYQQA